MINKNTTTYTFKELETQMSIIDEDGQTITGKKITDAILLEARIEIDLAKEELPKTYADDRLYQTWSAIEKNRCIHDNQLDTVFPECTIKIKV